MRECNHKVKHLSLHFELFPVMYNEKIFMTIIFYDKKYVFYILIYCSTYKKLFIK